jgi:hypothetical protein
MIPPLLPLSIPLPVHAELPINGGAIIDHETPDKRRFVAVPK